MRFSLRFEPIWGRRVRARVRHTLPLITLACVLLAAGPARAARCANAAEDAAVSAAIATIERSIDPCGESAEVYEVLLQFQRCAARGYRICMDATSERNFIERGTASDGIPSTITWNPGLRSELEWGCDGDPTRPVRRDPIASLLHELVHAVQDCHGLEPSDHEFEAVRVENIYRRAGKLCQRTRYGDRMLPSAMRVDCEPGACGCQSLDRSIASRPAAAPLGRSGASGSAGDTQP